MSAGEITEAVAEEALLEWFGSLGYEAQRGPEIAPGEPRAERGDYREVLLVGHLRRAVDHLNPDVPDAGREEAVRKASRAETASLIENNRRFHRMLVDGVEVEVADPEGRPRGYRVRLIDFADPEANDWLAVNQFTVRGPEQTRRPDVVVFVNGLPLALVELKDPTDVDADIWSAYNQLQTYKRYIPALLSYAEVLVISDAVHARLGSITAPREWFLPWRTVEGDDLAPPTANTLDVLIRGVFHKERFLDLVRHFVVFEEERGGVAKKIAGYHQFHATRKAVDTTVLATSPEGDRRAGVVWHTQGSGKSLTMAFYAGKLVLLPALENPTIVVITDRNDLDDQLYGVFSRCRELLRQTPERAETRAELRGLLQRASGGVIFTTIQKFLPEEKGDTVPELSGRRNIVVIADEAHRSQYGFVKGFARSMREALPGATFVAFTGTPIELEDRDTRRVFGDYIDVYDIARAIEDGATVPIYYESRLVKLDLKPEERARLDEEFEVVTEGEEAEQKEKLKSKWARLEEVVGSETRLEVIARDLVAHFERRREAMEGKAMVVCMSRRVCVELHRQIVNLRPNWHADEDDRGAIKVVMTGSAADPAEWQSHIRSKARREALANRFKDPSDPLQVVIVRDMWLTGFDAPSLHTMYVDKPMRGHTLMQAIARVNRVFRDKPGGRVVDYLGIAEDLRRALGIYAQSGGSGTVALDVEEAVRALQERYEVCRGLFHGFDHLRLVRASPGDRLSLMPAAVEHILSFDDGRDRLVAAVTELSKAFALAVPRDEALAIRDEVGFFQEVKAWLVKTEAGRGRAEEDLDHAIRQVVSEAIAPQGVIDIFEAVGLPKPDISLLSEEFLAEVRRMPQRNLAAELLYKLLNDEVRQRSRKYLVQSRRFSEMLDDTMRRYQAKAITTAQVIEELIGLAKEMKQAQRRGEDLGLSDEELAFYDALETNDSAVKVLGDEALRAIARELTETVKRNATIDWMVKENVRARLRTMVRRILRKHGYPPDKQERATQTVLAQAEQLGFEFAEAEAMEPEAEVMPFRFVPPEDLRPFENAIPLYSLAAAAGHFGGTQVVEPDGWVDPQGRTRPREGLFVAQVLGESMNLRVPNGAYCVFRHPVEGSRQGKIVLVQHRSIDDPDHGGSYTVKVYESSKGPSEEGGWEHERIVLKPHTTAAGYEPIALDPGTEGEVAVIAELVEVLPLKPVG